MNLRLGMLSLALFVGACDSSVVSESEGSGAMAGTGGGMASGGANQAGDGAGAAAAYDPQSAISGCLDVLVRSECTSDGDVIVASALGEPLGSFTAACGSVGLGDTRAFLLSYPVADGVMVEGLRIRDAFWETPAHGEWLELTPPAPILITDAQPLGPVLDWTAHYFTFPLGSGFLFQEMQTDDATVVLDAPITLDDVALGNAQVVGTYELRGGRFLRVVDDERVLFDDDGALSQGCFNVPLFNLLVDEGLHATACTPDFDTCPADHQACSLSASGTITMCVATASCLAECPFACGEVGDGDC